MEYLLGATIFVGYVVLLIWTILQFAETDNKMWLLAHILLWIIGFSFVFKYTSEDANSGPCLKEGIGYAYNPSTKTTMPYSYCEERGVWLKEDI